MEELHDIIKPPGGRAYIKGTNTPVWMIYHLLYKCVGDWFILKLYPSLTHEHLEQVGNYFSVHKDEIKQDIREEQKDCLEANFELEPDEMRF